MKKLIILAVFIASLASEALGQVSFSPIFSFSSSGKSASLIDRTSIGFILAYDLSEHCGIGFEVSKGSWELNGLEERVLRLRSYSMEFYVCETVINKTGWFFRPLGGIMAGIGTSIPDGDQNQKLRRKELELLKHPYFLGAFSQISVCKRLSSKFLFSAGFRLEGLVGMMADRDMVSENASTTSNFILNTGVIYELGH